MKVSRGEQLEHVRVEFLVENQPGQRFDIAIPEMLYQSRQGVSGALEVRTDLAGHRLAFGVLCDKIRRSNASRELRRAIPHDLGSERVRFGFNFEQLPPAMEQLHGERLRVGSDCTRRTVQEPRELSSRRSPSFSPSRSRCMSVRPSSQLKSNGRNAEGIRQRGGRNARVSPRVVDGQCCAELNEW